MNKTSLYVSIHALQTVPASCINRDDTGSPKSMVYGGTQRMRVSSQCWKRAIRLFMRDHYGDDGIRTKSIVHILTQAVVDEYNCDRTDAAAYVVESLKGAKIISKNYKAPDKADKSDDAGKDDKKDTSAFFSARQIEALKNVLVAEYKKEEPAANTDTETPADEPAAKETAAKNTKKKAQHTASARALRTAITENPSMSELLFGRMFAADQSLNYDAATQVAHAFSVDAAEEEPDYFTVVGDLVSAEAGAGSDYLDTKLYNSGTLYRYANVNLSDGTELRKDDYGIDAAETVGRFLDAFALSMPTGSINGYANMTLPDTIVVELRDDIPVSYAPAFAKAISGKRPDSEELDISGCAAEALNAYMDKIDGLYGKPVKRWRLGEHSLKEIRTQVEEEIRRRV